MYGASPDLGTMMEPLPPRAEEMSLRSRNARLARRDIWLLSDGRLWRVVGRLGGDGGQEVYDFADEVSARSMVGRMMKTSACAWRDLTEAIRQDASRRRILIDVRRATVRVARRTA